MKKHVISIKRNSSDSTALFNEIRALILSVRKAVVRNIDTLQVITNFEVGRRIVDYEQRGKKRADYGEKIISGLSNKLTQEFGRGYSKTNLKLMRKFFVTYSCRIGQMSSDQFSGAQKKLLSPGRLQNFQASSAQLVKHDKLTRKFMLSWSQYVFLIGIKDESTRDFYEIEAADNNWTLPELERQFNSGLYERLALSRDKDSIRKLAKEGQLVAKPQDLLKEPYVLEFLGLNESAKYSESDLESAIIDKIEHFLLELGKGFLFEARQKRFTFEEDHFFVDLVFYNRLIGCYVLVDLKVGKLTHQDLGQMQMYVNYFDRHVKTKNEKPTIGIILCRKNREALVEITLPKGANIHAKEYQLYLPSKDELKRKLIEWTRENGGVFS